MTESTSSSNSRKNHSIPNDLLNDLSSRFVINVPEEERMDLIRLCFQIELAHWFYLDFYCEENPKLPKTALKDFIRIIFGHIPFLQQYSSAEVDAVITNWREYKKAVPTYGAILIDEEMKNVLLVQSFVYRASWSFPKGKVNKDEQPHHCAIREVLEETGFDISHFINKEDYLEYFFNDQLIRLYIVTGIPANAKFVPKTRNEIKGCEWFPISQLPTGKKEPNLKPNSYFMVIPFVKQLKKWIQEKAVESENQFLKQNQLLAQLIKGDFTKYPESTSSSEPRTNRQNKSGYSPPPRMLRQKNLKHAQDQEKKKSAFTNPQNEEKTAMYSKYTKKLNAGSPKNDKYENSSKKLPDLDDRTAFPISKTWQNFSLDCEALIATFNINLRKTASCLK